MEMSENKKLDKDDETTGNEEEEKEDVLVTMLIQLVFLGMMFNSMRF